ncbi:MAG: peptide chain release factor N(5)-glutamine methyltransferase [Candidatus Methylacidiphilales bacterium]
MTLLDVLNASADYLGKHRVPSPKLQAELLLAHLLGLPRLHLYLQFDRPMMKEELDQLRPLLRRRAAREPLQHLIGTVDFYGLSLAVSPSALIPRPETESLIAMVLKALPADRPINVVDVGTGSGAIALVLAQSRPLARVIGIDTSPEALTLAEHNRARLGLTNVSFQCGDLLECWTDPVDWIVANLPYLTDAEMAALEPEVTKEPILALSGGPDGLNLIRRLVPQAARLAPNLALETGIHHGPSVSQLLHDAGYPHVEILPDLTGRNRFALGTAAPLPSTSP